MNDSPSLPHHGHPISVFCVVVVMAFLFAGCATPPSPSNPQRTAQKKREVKGGVGGTGYVGSLEAFGSIIVNQAKIELPPRVKVRLNGKPSSTQALALGQRLSVEATELGGKVEAEHVNIRHTLTGPITRIGPMAIMGIPIITDANTHWAPALRRSQLAPRARLTISGSWLPSGALIATRVDPAGPNDMIRGRYDRDRSRIEGLPVSRISGKTRPVIAHGRYDPNGLQVIEHQTDRGYGLSSRVRTLSVIDRIREVRDDQVYTSHGVIEIPRGQAARLKPGDILWIKGANLRREGRFELPKTPTLEYQSEGSTWIGQGIDNASSVVSIDMVTDDGIAIPSSSSTAQTVQPEASFTLSVPDVASPPIDTPEMPLTSIDQGWQFEDALLLQELETTAQESTTTALICFDGNPVENCPANMSGGVPSPSIPNPGDGLDNPFVPAPQPPAGGGQDTGRDASPELLAPLPDSPAGSGIPPDTLPEVPDPGLTSFILEDGTLVEVQGNFSSGELGISQISPDGNVSFEGIDLDDFNASNLTGCRDAIRFRPECIAPLFGP